MTDLPKRKLGRTGLDVTMLGYYAVELRGPTAYFGRPVRPEDASAVLNAVLNAGINYISTSIDAGQSEELIGKYISHRRSDYHLATTCGCLVGGVRERFTHVFTRENILAGVNQSLARMKTDYIDVVQFHLEPSKETLEENGAVEALLNLKNEGKVRFIGMFCGGSPEDNLADHIAMGVFDVFQMPYHALRREHEEAISRAAHAGAGIVVRGGAARGELAKEEGRSWESWQKVGLDDLLGDMSRTEFILRFSLSHPEIATTLVGTISLDHLQDNVRALQKGPLPPDLYAEAKARLAAAGFVPQSMSH